MTVNPYRFLASLVLVVVVFFSLLPGVHGEATATAVIQGKLLLPSGEPVTNTTRITINDGEYATYSQKDGAFIFHAVGPGVHALSVHSPEHHFPLVKIQLKEDSDPVMEPKCISYAYAGAAKVVVAHPLELTALAAYQYFEPKPRFNPLRLLKNPMVLMMVVSGTSKCSGWIVVVVDLFSEIDTAGSACRLCLSKGRVGMSALFVNIMRSILSDFIILTYLLVYSLIRSSYH